MNIPYFTIDYDLIYRKTTVTIGNPRCDEIPEEIVEELAKEFLPFVGLEISVENMQSIKMIVERQLERFVERGILVEVDGVWKVVVASE